MKQHEQIILRNPAPVVKKSMYDSDTNGNAGEMNSTSTSSNVT